ncbi:MAG: putative lipid II flippase FtsW [Eubacteriaceae bacterium]
MPLEKGKWDINILLVTLALTCFGVVMIFSASMYSSSVELGNEYYYFRQQMLAALLGITAMLVCSNIQFNVYRRFAKLGIIISVLLLIAVFVPGIGKELNDAKRWINLGFTLFQPSEFVKLAVILYMADALEKSREKVRTFRYGILPYLVLAGVICGLIYFEPNLSTALVIICIIFGMMFIAGVNLKYIMIMGVIGVAGVIVLMTQVGWRMGRISAMFDPWAYKLNEGWQIIQSLMALGSGGVFGQGLGNGKQKLLFMPEAENDYIFAHIGEELGLIGTLLVLFAFMYLLLRGTRVAINVKDRFASLVASGFMIMIGIQVMINIAVVTNSIPSTGIPLPFLSYGGTSLLANLIAIGILLNISKYTDTT